jgi:hypothetical protein
MTPLVALLLHRGLDTRRFGVRFRVQSLRSVDVFWETKDEGGFFRQLVPSSAHDSVSIYGHPHKIVGRCAPDWYERRPRCQPCVKLRLEVTDGTATANLALSGSAARAILGWESSDLSWWAAVAAAHGPLEATAAMAAADDAGQRGGGTSLERQEAAARAMAMIGQASLQGHLEEDEDQFDAAASGAAGRTFSDIASDDDDDDDDDDYLRRQRAYGASLGDPAALMPSSGTCGRGDPFETAMTGDLAALRLRREASDRLGVTSGGAGMAGAGGWFAAEVKMPYSQIKQLAAGARLFLQSQSSRFEGVAAEDRRNAEMAAWKLCLASADSGLPATLPWMPARLGDAAHGTVTIPRLTLECVRLLAPDRTDE